MIHLELSLEEVQLLLKHVAAGPYIEVANLIGKIQQQAVPQTLPPAPSVPAVQPPEPDPN